MTADILKIAPFYSQIMKKLNDTEASIKEEVGLELKLHIKEMDNDYPIDYIVRLVADALKIPIGRIVNTKRGDSDSSEARQISIYLIMKYLPHLSQEDVSQYFKRDRSTISHALLTINNFLDINDDRILKKVGLCQSAINNLINTNESQLH